MPSAALGHPPCRGERRRLALTLRTPLRPQFDLSIQRLLATRIAVYLMTFLIVTVAWAAHTRWPGTPGGGRLQLPGGRSLPAPHSALP